MAALSKHGATRTELPLTLRLCWASRAGISPRRKMALALKTCESLHMKAMIQRRPSEVCTVSVKM